MMARMKIDKTETYPGATNDDVFALVRDEDFRAHVAEQIHALAYEITSEEVGDGLRIQIDRTMPAELPDFVKKLTGDTIEVRQVETWGPRAADGSRDGTVRVTIKGQPAQMNGTMRIADQGQGAGLTLEGEVKVAIPLLGKRIEPEVAKAILAALDVEAEEGRARLGS